MHAQDGVQSNTPSPDDTGPEPGGIHTIGIDTGGTFTDFVFRSPDGHIRVRKLPSTPDDPSRVIREELRSSPRTEVRAGEPSLRLIHGTTVATNTLLQRRGVKTALVTTRGFADVVEIGRQDRPRIYDLQWRPPPPLVPRELRFEVTERIAAGGEVLTSLDEAEVAALLEPLRAAKVEAIAVCFLFSPQYRAHEERAAEILQSLGVPVVLSSDIVPELREYERFTTTTISAYVAPVMERYLAKLANAIAPEGRLLVMGSQGGARPWQEMSAHAVQTVLSGPAGGVVAASYYGERWEGCDGVVAFDMGGTSTDVALVPRGPVPHTRDFRVDGLPVAVPVVDVHTIGAGGGSEAWIDAGQALRVGPRSAGAVPGPVCYQRGGVTPTVTDANLALGRLPSAVQLGGEMPMSADGVDAALAQLGGQVELPSVHLALGIVRVVEAEMERALRKITQERGVDPRALVLLPFGGAAGLHAVSLARRLQMREVRVPRDPGVLSATGMLLAPILETQARSIVFTCERDSADQLLEAAAELGTAARTALAAEWGDVADACELRCQLSMRYQGQSHSLEVVWSRDGDPRAPFWQEYERRYGLVDKERAVEVTGVRVSALLAAPDAAAAFATSAGSRRSAPTLPPGEARTRIEVILDDGETAHAWFVQRDALVEGQVYAGPAIVSEASSTLWLPAGATMRVDSDGTLVITTQSDSQAGKNGASS